MFQLDVCLFQGSFLQIVAEIHWIVFECVHSNFTYPNHAKSKRQHFTGWSMVSIHHIPFGWVSFSTLTFEYVSVRLRLLVVGFWDAGKEWGQYPSLQLTARPWNFIWRWPSYGGLRWFSNSKAAPHMSLPMRGSMGSQTKEGKEGFCNWIFVETMTAFISYIPSPAFWDLQSQVIWKYLLTFFKALKAQ